jgi:putative spermidine/putrescine transport system substrate-binding protein
MKETSEVKRAITRLGIGIAVLAVTVTGCSSSSTKGPDAKSAKATSAADFGGMDKLVAAAKKEGNLHVIALPRDWANYGAIMDAFTKKYGIKIESENPDGSSQDEINAITSRKGQTRAPDVVDVGLAFANQGSQQGLFAPYKAATWSTIPDAQKEASGAYYNDYGGFMSIGCTTKKVKVCPTSFADLVKPEYKKMVGIRGNPGASNTAFSTVFAAAEANKGSFDNIQPGIDFFGKVKKAGNYVPVEAKESTVESGETPILIDWDYKNLGYADTLKTKGIDFTTAVPKDSSYAAFYDQAINKWAPHPAAARLWEEFLFSDEGQNLWLKGYAHPVRLDAMKQAGTADQAGVAKLPPVAGTATFPTQAQLDAAQKVVIAGWPKAVG